MEITTFYIGAGVALVSALMVVLLRRAVYSALALVVCLGSLALLFFQLGAHFIGAIQIILYAGAIMVLFLFVIMLLDPESESFPKNRLRWVTWLALPAAGLIFFGVASTAAQFSQPSGQAVAVLENTKRLAEELFRTYLLPFEVTSILILVAVVGAVVLSKRPHS